MSEWQPIETAPHDGSVVLGYYYRLGSLGVRIMYFVTAGAYTYWTSYGGDDDTLFPTHWMPLPSAPTTAAQREDSHD